MLSQMKILTRGCSVGRLHNNAPENVYIQKAALNGKRLDACWFYHKDFAKGGVLELWLGPKPNKEWGLVSPVAD